jgi:hypothetical protein
MSFRGGGGVDILWYNAKTPYGTKHFTTFFNVILMLDLQMYCNRIHIVASYFLQQPVPLSMNK